jgi:acyl-CoA thioesterase II
LRLGGALWRNAGMSDFVADTAVEGADGHYRAQLSRDWEIWGPNGGYVAAIALRAAGAATALRRPASFAGHFLGVADFAAVDLEVTTLRAAKRAVSLRVSMTQEGRPIFEAIVWVVGEVNGLEHDVTDMPPVPLPSQLKSMEDLVPPEDLQQRYRFWNNFESRPIDFVPWSQREPGAPQWREWYRFRPRATCDDPFADAARSLLLIDTMGWPAACRAYPHNNGYLAPSLDVTAQFHRLAPGSDWLLVDAVAPVAAHGLIGGQARVWSVDGHLLASGGGQLLCRPAPLLSGGS